MSIKNYHHGDLKKQMILKGLELLNEKGTDGFSLRKIAAMCDVSHTAPYKHFKDKHDLINEISNYVISEFDNSIINSLDKSLNPKDLMIEIGKSYIKFMVENSNYLKFLMFNDSLFSAKMVDGDILNSNSKSFNIFKDNAIKMFECYGIEKEEYTLNIITMWSVVQGVSVLVANKNIVLDCDYDILLDKILRNKLKLD
ncbi:TetR/AcrR family transcriptional regulator [Romboutsia sp. CE17]|uniref:TetR/AcrR family transcriptional regulator n=1 Tax=Romboutsia sp. CE17 TaxID=2724150 RepID=UPI001442B8FB|nr:TetR/AcrR family transcriptional regulator [Romboutsia sp. CE17]QJA07678.1 TetR/AcrR family transcriptional regulator [Romboutsia sp. CE17]